MAKQGVIERALLLLSIVLPLGASVWAGPIDEVSIRNTVTTVDMVPPSPVTNLTAQTGSTPGTVVLSWNASGDDATTGTATAYAIRYAATPIDEAAWDTATDVTGEPAPASAGTPQSMVVSGLAPSMRMYFALKILDEVPNTSEISNVASTVTQRHANVVVLPLVASNVSSTPVVIPDTTEVLPDSTLDDLEEVSNDGAVFTFNALTPALEDLNAGDVMIAGVSAATPEGALRRVTDVTVNGDDVVVTTVQATLEEAIQDGAFVHSGRLSPSQVVSSTQMPGVSLASAAGLGDEFYIKIEDVEFDYDGDPATTNDILEVDGSLRFALDFDFSLAVSHWQLKQLEFVGRATETAEIEARWNVLDIPLLDEERVLARYALAPITVMVGPVPVVFVPEIIVKVSLKGEIKVGLVGKVTQQARFTAGVRYAAGTWRGIGDLDNGFSSDPARLSGSASLDVKVAAPIDMALKLYGVAGPYFTAQAYLKFEADTAEDPWWTLYGGLEVPIGVRGELLGTTLPNYATVAIGYRIALAHAQTNDPPYAPSVPSPTDGASNRSINTNLSWTGGDPNDDALTYDVYFEVWDSTPDVRVSATQSDDYFDPGVLAVNTTYYWQIVAKDEHGATTSGPIWRFTAGTSANQQPYVPSNPTPGDGAVNQELTVELGWIGGDPDGDAVTYAIYFERDDTTPDRVVSPSQSATIYDPGLLAAETTYYWQIFARDAHGETAYGPVWRFTTATTVPACIQPPLDLMSWWPGEGSANDIQGTNDGTLMGGVNFSTGMVGQTFTFDGVDDKVLVPHSVSLNPTGGFTIEGWIFPTWVQTDTSHQNIFSKWGGTGGWKRAYSFLGLGLKLQFAISDPAHEGSNSFHVFNTPSDVLTLNAWNHVAAVYDQSTGTRRIYVNGVLKGTRTDPPITVTATLADATIGALTDRYSSGEFFDGRIDELSFYHRALSENEIQAIYASGTSGKCTPVVAACTGFDCK